MTDIATIRAGYHWFRHHEDGSAFIALAEDGFWFMPGMGVAVPPAVVKANATYPQPVSPPASRGLN